MSKHAVSLNLTEREKNTLEQWLRAGTVEQLPVERARMLLTAEQALTNPVFAAKAGDVIGLCPNPPRMENGDRAS